MEIRFRKSARKFLLKADKNTANRIREKLLILKNSLEDEGRLPLQDLDIKQLKGQWIGFWRIRVGDIRIIFKIDETTQSLLIYDLSSRGNIYK
ncbi:type II toxin-antitoxin system RelE/ParE family toxin [Spirulina sp. CS-785/01]|uniref:type II toxin-antitoxin system RelE family toxin n=1 Tax=Spirulina sp. CS-785/01 TaxID=3021716 RepID=UPI00232AFC5C|nr:type II toxin-antitoxin system RelE/ParE family toxin [Spirulina sp. CS-785/01]MDB9312768.1 type II toxin-antitoxin system RelE/ParE family toxin [Spirulina sp. CS-785/01]